MKRTTLVVAVAASAAAAILGPAVQAVAGERIVALPVTSGRITLPGLSEEIQASGLIYMVRSEMPGCP